ncbi:MAG TPA: glycosyltransferase family 4 protein, partial [Gemmatimonadales bacterium]|nr:glycosyltransferase family 4 protein [Gemmatimonadales bacterium]
ISPRQFFPGRRLWLAWRAVFQYCRTLVRTQNIKVISAYHISRHGTLGAWLNAETRVPLITTIFGEIYSQTDYFWKNRAEAEFVASHSARLLSCSRHCARSVRLLDVDWPVEPLLYGIDLGHFRPGQDGSPLRRRFGWDAADKVVAYVGRMNHEMGVSILLRAIPKVLARNPNVRFLLVGAADDLVREVQACAAANPRNVAFFPNVPFEQLPAVYAAATVTVAPSINERACLGLAIIEAMGCAKPVVGTRVGGTEEVLVEGETGYLAAPRDSTDLAEKLLRALAAPAYQLSDMGKRGRARAEVLFDKDLTNRRFESIIQEVVGSTAPHTSRYNSTP